MIEGRQRTGGKTTPNGKRKNGVTKKAAGHGLAGARPRTGITSKPTPLFSLARPGAKLFSDDVVAGAFQVVFELPPIDCRQRFGAGKGAKDHQGSENG